MEDKGVTAGAALKWEVWGVQDCLVIRFDGHLNPLTSRKAALEMQDELSNVEGQCPMIWDCRQMTGYDAGARKAWQDVLGVVRDRVSVVHLISDAMTIRVGAAMVGLAAGLSIKTWSSKSELQMAEQMTAP